jgi:alkylhydroperoxidase family enzyme
MSDPLRMLVEMREQVGAGPAAPPAILAAYLEKVRHRAIAVTDAEVEALLASGLGEDEVYEATMHAAMSAGIERFEIGLRALAEAKP